MGFRVPGQVLKEVELEKKRYFIYRRVYYGESGEEEQICIGPVNAVGTIAEALAEAVAVMHGLQSCLDNFGGWSGGDPPDWRTVFVGPLGTKYEELINAVKDFHEAIKRLVRKALSSIDL